MPATPAPPARRPVRQTRPAADEATVVPAAHDDATLPTAGEPAATVVGGHAATAADGKTQAVKTPGGKATVRKIGEFALLKKLGAGGMGDVYLAKQTSLDRKVALKTLKPDLAKRPDFVARFMREARSMGRLDHPNVVRIYGAETTEIRGKPFAYAAIEYVDGKSMQDWMDELKSLSVADAVSVTLTVADALRHAHDLNMIHRDVKPDNILLTAKGVVKVADFGLAKAIDEDQSLTQSGVGMGTPLYMAPEQARNAKYVDARSDVYALGATLYYFLTGDLPFRAESTIALLQAKEAGRFESARKKNAAIPERLDFVLDKMMAKDPDRRYADCGAVIADLTNLNLAGTALSFVDGAVATAAVAGSTSPTKAASRPARPRTVTSREEAEQARLEKAKGRRWYVRSADRQGRIKEQRLATEQVLKGIKAGMFDLKTQVKKKADGTYVSLAQFPEFEAEANRLAVKAADAKRGDAAKQQMAKLARQQDRRGTMRKIGRFFDGVKGLASLLALLAALGAAGWAAYTYGLPLVQEQLGGATAEAPAE